MGTVWDESGQGFKAGTLPVEGVGKQRVPKLAVRSFALLLKANDWATLPQSHATSQHLLLELL